MLLAISAASLLSSCAKLIDYKRHHPGADEHLCNIEKFFTTSYNNTTGVPEQPVEYDISYNAKGNPTRIGPLASPPAGFYAYISKFRYDNKNRVIDYRLDGIFSPTDSVIIFEHSYYYPPDGKTIVDTESQFPPVPNPTIHTYILDTEGRIVRDGPFKYTYDAAGNLASIVDESGYYPPVYHPVYDNKVNWRKTNSVWQLVELNYSRNNAIDPGAYQITGYNSFDLPLRIVQTPNPPDYANFQATIFSNAYMYNILDFQYACDVPKGPHK